MRLLGLLASEDTRHYLTLIDLPQLAKTITHRRIQLLFLLAVGMPVPLKTALLRTALELPAAGG